MTVTDFFSATRVQDHLNNIENLQLLIMCAKRQETNLFKDVAPLRFI